MSEGILKVLMQLFALVSSPDQNEDNRRNVVHNYLLQQLNHQRVNEYLILYDDYLKKQEFRLKEKSKLEKRHASSSVKLLYIATKINEELTHYQKVVVTIQLLEFLNSSTKGISAKELEFANLLAQTFNIDSSEYLEIFAFITDDFKSRVTGNNQLIISGNKDLKDKIRFLYREHLRNELRLLNIRSANLVIVKAMQGSDLTINGQIIQPKRIHFMRPGSSLRHNRITPITFTDITSHFYKSEQEEPITFDVNNISFKYSGSQSGLNSMSFISESGSLVGIMGDSGSGKTTLINLLTGMLKPKSGQVTINNIDIHQDAEKLKGLIGYVSQDDLLMEDLTVYQNLYYNARLCFDHLSDSNIKRKVLMLLKSLGLYEIRSMKVGNPLNKKISGGQRKRLNIALELIREPAIMFLDEPTSGLSSSDSENIMDLLNELTLKGKLIFVVIHQPSSDIFKMFDQLLVLDSGGYLIYEGDPVEAINFFKDCVDHVNREESECMLCGNVNPEQILTIVNSHVLDEYGAPTDTRKISPEEWYQVFDTSAKNNKKKKNKFIPGRLPEINFKTPNKFKQFIIFVTRDVASKLANKQYILINLIESPLLALILASLLLYFDIGSDNQAGYVFYNNPNLVVYIIIAVIISIFIGLSVSAEEIISDRKILKRETFLNLSRFSYLLSKVFILAIISAIQTALFVLVGHSIIKLKGMAFTYWLMLFSASVFANLLGLNISDSFKKSVNIYIIIPFLIIPQLILSGVFVSYDKLNPNLSSVKTIPWYGELIVARWAFEGLAVHQFMNNEYQKNFYIYEKLKSQATFRKDFWITKLKNEINRYETTDLNEKKKITLFLKKEIETLNKKNYPGLNFDTNKITTESFTAENQELLKTFLEDSRHFFVKMFNAADNKQESFKKTIIDEAGNDYLTNLRNQYHNDNLERFVRRSDDIFANRVLKTGNELIQKFDPIYMDTNHSFVKAHFMAPNKRIGRFEHNTFNVNLYVIWVFNLILFVILYAGALKKLIRAGNRFRKKYITSILQNDYKSFEV